MLPLELSGAGENMIWFIGMTVLVLVILAGGTFAAVRTYSSEKRKGQAPTERSEKRTGGESGSRHRGEPESTGHGS